jgi:hypothetical protein
VCDCWKSKKVKYQLVGHLFHDQHESERRIGASLHLLCLWYVKPCKCTEPINLTKYIKMLRQIRYQKCIKNKVPGGDIVLSSTEGIVISIIGLLDGNPLVAS